MLYASTCLRTTFLTTQKLTKMKNFLLFTCWCCISMLLAAQPNDIKRDAVWLIGYNGEGPGADTSTYNGNTKCSFTENEVSMSILHTPIRFNETCAGISDTSGKMLFYTNGVIIILYLPNNAKQRKF